MNAAHDYFEPGVTIGSLLRSRAGNDGSTIFCRATDRSLTYAALSAEVGQLAGFLGSRGLGLGDRVAIMLPHTPDHIVVLLALARIGAIAVPLNPQLQGKSLEYILDHSEPAALICDRAFEDRIIPALHVVPVARVWWRGGAPAELRPDDRPLPVISELTGHTPPEFVATEDTTTAICYTSGTTGPPKGVLLSDKMYRCAATSSLILSGIKAGDLPLFWEPMYHLFGIEVVILALMKPVTLIMVDRFSASGFWDAAREGGATHIHYVGGVLQLLLKQPPSEQDRNHQVRAAWGGGCPTQIWDEMERRFGLGMRDSFGMTETSALNIVNLGGVAGALGKPLPYFEARVLDDDGSPTPPDQVGELFIRGKVPGLITAGYFRNPETTAETIEDGWLKTGDLVSVDREGIYRFFSRKKDCVRRRGENVSPWDVERVINDHPDVEECSLVGVRNEFDDEDLKIIIKAAPGRDIDPREFHDWCSARMPRFQVPRFVEFTAEFPKTSTQRIRKHELSRATAGCWDADSDLGKRATA